MGNPVSNTETSCSSSCEDECNCNNQSNQPATPCEPSTITRVGTSTVEISYKSDSPYGDAAASEYIVRSGCFNLPLKAGGELKLKWNMFPWNYYYYFCVGNYNGWQTGGRGGMFSFFPFLSAWSTPNDSYYRTSDKGTMLYQMTSSSGDDIFYGNSNQLPWAGRYNQTTKYFSENNEVTGAYFVYGGSGHHLYGCPVYARDKNGNELNYQYADNSEGYPLLRKITGDVAGSTPYFEYTTETFPAPITKIFLAGDSGNNRTLYFDYDSTTSSSNCFLNKISYPNGCSKQYKLIDQSDHTGIRAEIDADGYATYFNYSGWNMSSAVEPDGRLTYFNYGDYSSYPFTTTANIAGQGDETTTYQKIGSAHIPTPLKKADALGNTTYFVYDTSTIRMTREINPRNNVTYHEYNAGGALAKTIRAFDNATTSYMYEANNQDVRKEIGPRLGVTYYEYNTDRNRVSTVDPLDNITRTVYDSVGRIIKQCDARGMAAYFNYGTANGFLKSEVDALGQAAYFKYDDWGNQTGQISRRWQETGSYAENTTYYVYDQLNRRTQEITPLGQVTEFDYTSRSDISMQLDPRGTATYFDYNGLRLRTSKTIVDANNAELAHEEYRYTKAKTLSAVRDALGNTTYFFYDALGRQTGSLNAAHDAVYYRYDAVGNRIASIDAKGSVTYYVYDLADRQTAMLDALGNTAYYAYGISDNPVKSADQLGRVTYYSYDLLNRLISQRNPLGNSSYFFYDAVGNQTAMRDSLGRTSYFFYDALNRQSVAKDNLGNSTYFSYDANGNNIVIRDPLGHISQNAFDAVNRLTSSQDAMGNSTYYRYDATNNRTAVHDARSYSTYFRYDGLNRQTAIQDAVGGSTYFRYDANSNRTAVVDQLQHTTYFRYDVLNRLNSTRDALGNVSYFSYDANGNRTAVRNALGYSTYFAYDALNRQTVTINALGDSIDFSYDAVGNRTAVRDARGNSSYFVYDAVNQLHATWDALNHISYFAYDAVGNLTRTVDPLGHANIFTYDAVNRLKSSADALGKATYFSYDAVGNRTQLTDGLGQVTYYFYDELNRLSAMRNAIGQTEGYSYDANSNLVVSINPAGETTYFSYDSLNRQTGIAYPADSANYFHYNETSNLIGAAGSNSASSFSYDAVSRLTSETSQNGLVTHAYDAIGQRTRLIRTNAAVYFSYDAAGRMVSAGDNSAVASYGYGTQAYGSTPYGGQGTTLGYGQTAYGTYPYGEGQSIAGSDMGLTYYTYDAASNLQTKALGNNAASVLNYDANNRVLKLDNRLPDSATSTYFAYDYDAASRIVKIGREAGLATYYSYDSANRLTGETWKNAGATIYAFAYDYDAVGNRTYESRNGVQTYYTYDAVNKLLQSHNVTNNTYTYFAYDLSGNCTSIAEPDGTTYFAYNDSDLVKQITFKSGVTNYFYYDALMRRYAMEDSSGVTYFVWDKDGLNLLAEKDSAGNVTAEYIHGYSPIAGIGTMVAAKKMVGTTAYYQYPHYDHRGSVSTLTDKNGTAVASYLYDAWGNLLNATESAETQVVGNRFKYQSNWMTLKDSGGTICLSPTRLYVPGIGRFLQKDPAPRSEDNLYRYAKNNPLRYTDPTGRMEFPDVFGGTGGIPWAPAGNMSCCGDNSYFNPDTQCCFEKEPGQYITYDNTAAPTGFVAAGDVVMAVGAAGETKSQEAQRKIGNNLQINHYDIYLNGVMIYEGFAGAVNSKVVHKLTNLKIYDLTRKDKDSLLWGNYKGLSCKCASAEMIMNCIKAHPTPRRDEYSALGGNNCQTDVQHAASGCCLEGFSALGLPPSEKNYISSEEQSNLGVLKNNIENMQAPMIPELFISGTNFFSNNEI